MPDWTVAIDDFLVQRYRNCIFCAQPADHVELRSVDNGEAMTMAVCQKCLDADAQGTRRSALVEAHARQQPPR